MKTKNNAKLLLTQNNVLEKPALARRHMLQMIGCASLTSVVSGCANLQNVGDLSLSTTGSLPAALLVPLSGPRARLGQIMASAARLVEGQNGVNPKIAILDTQGTPAGAVKAARQALSRKSRILLGPLLAGPTRAVLKAVGTQVPVVSFSNDANIARAGGYVFGITIRQSAETMFGFAANRGLKSVAVITPPGIYGQRAIEVSRSVAANLGMAFFRPVVQSASQGLLRSLKNNNNGRLPDAVYLPSAGKNLPGYARALALSNIQVMGSLQWSSIAPETLPDLDGAWFAAPDPIGNQRFQQDFQNRTGARAGILAGLAYDATAMALFLGRSRQAMAKGLVRPQGFKGVLGPYRFNADGTCARGLSVLSVSGSETILIGTIAL